MDGAAQILVIILASALAVFLVLAIIATVLLIKFLKALSRLAEKAEHLTDAAEAFTDSVKNVVQSLPLIRWVEKLAGVFQAQRSAKNKRTAKGGSDG